MCECVSLYCLTTTPMILNICGPIGVGKTELLRSAEHDMGMLTIEETVMRSFLEFYIEVTNRHVHPSDLTPGASVHSTAAFTMQVTMMQNAYARFLHARKLLLQTPLEERHPSLLDAALCVLVERPMLENLAFAHTCHSLGLLTTADLTILDRCIRRELEESSAVTMPADGISQQFVFLWCDEETSYKNMIARDAIGEANYDRDQYLDRLNHNYLLLVLFYPQFIVLDWSQFGEYGDVTHALHSGSATPVRDRLRHCCQITLSTSPPQFYDAQARLFDLDAYMAAPPAQQRPARNRLLRDLAWRPSALLQSATNASGSPIRLCYARPARDYVPFGPLATPQ